MQSGRVNWIFRYNLGPSLMKSLWIGAPEFGPKLMATACESQGALRKLGEMHKIMICLN